MSWCFSMNKKTMRGRNPSVNYCLFVVHDWKHRRMIRKTDIEKDNTRSMWGWGSNGGVGRRRRSLRFIFRQFIWVLFDVCHFLLHLFPSLEILDGFAVRENQAFYDGVQAVPFYTNHGDSVPYWYTFLANLQPSAVGSDLDPLEWSN